MYYVSMTDNYLSGWGRSAGKTNKLVLECETHEEALIVKNNAEDREDMRTIKIHIKKPKFDPTNNFVQYKDKTEYKTWYRNDEPFIDGRDKPKVKKGSGINLANNIWGALTNPVITWSGYEDSGKQQSDNIVLDRLVQLMKNDGTKQIKEATDREAMLYISTASFVNPIGTIYSRIYRYLFDKLYPVESKKLEKSMKDENMFSPMRLPIKLTQEEKRELAKLKQWLWKRQNRK